MLNEIENKPVGELHIYSQSVGNYIKRIIAEVRNAPPGANMENRTINILATAVVTAYELGMRDGKVSCSEKIKKMFCEEKI